MTDLLSEVRKHMALLSDPTKVEHHDHAYDALMGHVTARPAAHDEDRTAKVRALRAAIGSLLSLTACSTCRVLFSAEYGCGDATRASAQISS